MTLPSQQFLLSAACTDILNFLLHIFVRKNKSLQKRSTGIISSSPGKIKDFSRKNLLFPKKLQQLKYSAGLSELLQKVPNARYGFWWEPGLRGKRKRSGNGKARKTDGRKLWPWQGEGQMACWQTYIRPIYYTYSIYQKLQYYREMRL